MNTAVWRDTYLAHGAEEGLHSPARETPCWRRLQQDGAELDRSAVR